MTNLFTPRIDLDKIEGDVEGLVMFDHERAKLSLSGDDRNRFDNLPHRNSKVSVVVEDELSGLKMEVSRASCGAGCFCAAEVVAIVE